MFKLGKLKVLKRVRTKYASLKKDEHTSKLALWYLVKYLYMNFRLYLLKQEVEISYCKGKVKALVKKGDGIAANFHSRFHEPTDTIFLINYLDNTDHFIDIGANVGHFTLIAAKIAQCKVTAIEPVPATFARLVKNVELNEIENSVNCLNIGLAEETGILRFSDSFHTTNKVISEGSGGVEIEVKKLDDLCENAHPTVLKIDVEGYEYFLLKGALKTLALDSLNVIIIELNESSKTYGVDEEMIIDLLIEKSFKPISFNPVKNTITQLKRKDSSKFNTIFVKDIDQLLARIKSNRFATDL